MIDTADWLEGNMQKQKLGSRSWCKVKFYVVVKIHVLTFRVPLRSETVTKYRVGLVRGSRDGALIKRWFRAIKRTAAANLRWNVKFHPIFCFYLNDRFIT